MEINGKVIYPSDHSIEYVNGAFGRINNHGEVIINFFMDNYSPSSEFKVVLEQNKPPFDVYKNVPEVHRYVKSSLILDLENAKSIAKWLTDLCVQAEMINQGKNGVS